MFNNYETVIGLEVHSQLLTNSKMFCSCNSQYQTALPNSLVCPVCLGMPGVLPVVNKKAVEFVIRTGLALGCRISNSTKFDRKNYPYPDLMKGYQISQFDIPIAGNGSLYIQSDGQEKRIGVTRVHLEEDVAKLLHRSDPDGKRYSLLDVNRAGVALMEVVSEPDMRSAEEARKYLTELHSTLQFLEVTTANMEDGSFRCDANISIRPYSVSELGPKVEVKNMNSFRSVYRALEFEVDRQRHAINKGERVIQETRGWDDQRGMTFPQRSKEYASDYRYFPEPDIPPIVISGAWIDEIKEGLPELPQARRLRFVKQYDLPEYDANLLTSSKAMADYFELVIQDRKPSQQFESQFAKSASNWLLGELLHLLNATNTEISEVKITPHHFVELLQLVNDDILSMNLAKVIFEDMFKSGRSPKMIAEESGMIQISDVASIQIAVEEAVSNNPQPVADFLNGRETAMRFLVGQVMKNTKGKANPKIVSDLLEQKLATLR